MNVIQQTMTTLLNYNKQLKTQPHIHMTQTKMS